MSGEFPVDAETLYAVVNDAEGGRGVLASLGGVASLATKLKTDCTTGLPPSEESAAAVAARVAHFGANELPEAEEVTFMGLVWESLEDRMMQILIVSAAISLLLGLTVPDAATGVVDYAHGWIEGAAILASVTLVTLVSALNNYQKEQKFKELARAAPPVRVSVMRGGRVREITDRELLVGDILHIAGGDVLTVDGVLLQGAGVKTDESAATGENDDISKSPVTDGGAATGDCLLRSGSYVVEGEGTALVTGVGVHSFAGRIAMQVREGAEETPLQEKLTALADLIGYFGMVAAGLMFVILGVREALDTFVWRTHPFNYKKYLDNLTTAVTIVVVAVPEGLPLSVTIALAYSMKQMFHEKNLVRHLAACETMGSATTICTDKTGTITQNEMTVTGGISPAGVAFQVPAGPSSPIGAGAAAAAAVPELTQVLSAPVAELLAQSIALNTKAARAVVSEASSPAAAGGGVRYVGNKTEQALLAFVERLGADPMAERAACVAAAQDASSPSPSGGGGGAAVVAPSWPGMTAGHKAIHVYPFSSARKRMTTAAVLPRQSAVRYHTKGAAEIVLAECTHTHDKTGARVPLDGDLRARLLEGIYALSRARQRVLAIASSDLPLPVGGAAAATFAASDERLPGLTLLAVVGIRDPVRPEVPHAIARCRRAGVTVRMITGDNKATAVSIAREVGIYGPVWFGRDAGEQGLALEGPQFRALAASEAKLDLILPRLQVISRASPTDKQILVAALMKRGEVVAVTGDGTNDAPALRGADVGFSMMSGTEVAKNASDVVIMDDNFSTIVTAIKWGRNVNDNIRKFLQFQMTVNVAAVVVSFVGALLDGSGESPLKPVQLLWLNLIMDTLAALALATESPSEAVLERHSRPRDEPLITARMWLNIGVQSLYQIGLQLWLLRAGHAFFGVERDSEEHLSIVFNIFVLVQLVNEFNARLLDQTLFVFAGITRAPLFLLVVGSTFLIQVFGVQYGGALLRAVPLSADAWRLCFGFSVVPLPLGALLRMIPVPDAAAGTEGSSQLGKTSSASVPAPAPQRRRPTLKETARKVRLQLRVVKALQAKKSKTA